MGRKCTVCEDPQDEAIDIELAGGRSRGSVATEYRTTTSAMRRHAVAHLEPGPHRVTLGRESFRLGSMVDRLVQLSDHADTILTEALSDLGDRRVALAAIKETRELVAMLTRLVSPDTAETIEEAQRLVSALARVLPCHLDAAVALAAELEATGCEELATAISDMVAGTTEAAA